MSASSSWRRLALLSLTSLTLFGGFHTAPAADAAGTPTTFSCALAWDPTIPRATGVLGGRGVPSELVIHGGSGMTARSIYYFTPKLTKSTATSPYPGTPVVFDGIMSIGSAVHPEPFTDPVPVDAAMMLSPKATTKSSWKANFAVWPTSSPAHPNAICTTNL